MNKQDRKRLRGVNLGGWLMMEGYLLGGRNIAEKEFKRKFKQTNGSRSVLEFEQYFRDNFITEEDFKNIANMKANVIRLPFHYRLIEKTPFKYSARGLEYFRKVFHMANKYKLGVILDLHAAPGSQNCDWHSDSSGRALLWEDKELQERTYCLWERIADEFKDEPALVGYDLLNEPILEERKIKTLMRFYRNLIKRVKAIDSRHTLFVEGTNWSRTIDFLGDIAGDKISISIHTYEPTIYTFNLDPYLKFPGKVKDLYWDKDALRKDLEPYYKFSKKYKTRIFVGEFGVNWRGGLCGEMNWLKSVLECFDAFDFDYTYWSYKGVNSNIFPDGIYQYIYNNKYVSREGVLYGWENYAPLWKDEKQEIKEFWNTRSFWANKKIISLLSKHFLVRSPSLCFA